ncbi:hypothetical protein FW320_00270 [Azospirillum sp. Vi22]|uniref:hypothetical protein n=1 Tax=Azospirillum baldaniorum TaxID=1064539 RepID=UPI00157B9B8D|nr:hypothetical protein [Azospirillum baldaniorum]NUB04631.1 hypothetical protein [Azospirillum baldaniorum]
MSIEENQHISIRLSITRHGVSGWRWTMLLTSDDDALAAAAEFRSGEDGRGTWMRMVGDAEWAMVTAPEKRTYPADEEEARAEIAEVCVGAAAELVRRGVPLKGRDPHHDNLAEMVPAGSC